MRTTAGWKGGVGLALLAFVFSLGLAFASLELPALLHQALVEWLPTPGGDSHADDAARLRTELFLRHYRLRTVGWLCLGTTLGLVAAGFLLGRRGLAAAGAGLLLMPVFAQFATVMFFLAGLGLLNVAWLPALELGLDIGRLGDIVYLPYRLLLWAGGRLGLDLHRPLVLACIGGGLLLFTLGVLAWLEARSRGAGVAAHRVYRLSRHPQYLGWVLWSYGMLLATSRLQYPRRSWSIPASLPFLLSALVIIGVALLEEAAMRRRCSTEYEAFRARTPFLLPLPRRLARVLSAPCRALFGKELPERGGEIAAVLGIFAVALIGLSALSLELRGISRLPPEVRAATGDAARAEALAAAVRREASWRRRETLAAELEELGEAAVPPLTALLAAPEPGLRQLAAKSLGRSGSQAAAAPLCALLADPDPDLRHWAAWGLGQLRAGEAVEPLLGLLDEDTGTLRAAAAGALGRIGDRAAVAPLLAVLGDPRPWTRVAVVEALGALGCEPAVEPLLELLGRPTEDLQVRRAAAVALGQLADPRATPTLRRALDDPDPELRLYAAEALRILGGTGG